MCEIKQHINEINIGSQGKFKKTNKIPIEQMKTEIWIV